MTRFSTHTSPRAWTLPGAAVPHRSRLPVPLLCLAVAALGTACAVHPVHEAPLVPVPSHYKEARGWVPAAPADAAERGAWWRVFDDPALDVLAQRVALSNQNVAATAAAYVQARALVREQRASLFPVVGFDGGASRSGGGGIGTGQGGTRYQVMLGGGWEPDVWGRLGQASSSAAASAQASAADLASATLAAQGELVANYLLLRHSDAQMGLLDRTIEGYRRTLQITRNRYEVGVAPKTDVLQAEIQLTTAQAERMDLSRQRAQLEHAVAVLVGQPPASFSVPPVARWTPAVPRIPADLPSTLLQRRPDIAAAERRVASANAQIGLARSAYYPSIRLSASYGLGSSSLADLFSASTGLWALGVAAAQTLFDAGARDARVAQAQAAHERTVAQYRQTVLAAFQEVEDQLAASRVLEQQQTLREQASRAADEAEAQVFNRYRAGQVGYVEVVTAQVTALNARRALLRLAADRQVTAVALIQSLGGAWGAAPPPPANPP